MLEVLQALGGQVRVVAGVGGGGVTGLDMSAALALGQARGCDMDLLARVLPDAELAVLAHHSDDVDSETIEDDWNKEVGE